MISLEHETLISLNEAAARLPSSRAGKRIHVSSVYRWAGRGVRGVRLETVSIGGATKTSVQALQRFADRLSAARSTSDPEPSPGDPKPLPATDAAIDQRLEMKGLLPRHPP